MPFPAWLRVHDPAYAARVLGVRAQAEAAPGQPADVRQSLGRDVDALMALVAEQAAGDAFARRCVALLGQARAELGSERPDPRRVVEATEEVRRLLIRSRESKRPCDDAGGTAAGGLLRGVAWRAGMARLRSTAAVPGVGCAER
ncbi:MAG: hypothetical protein Q7T26_00165 [Dehalococcoidia bacterium]|nr:hypothetical protein [Dehalococcoidia bacterium]